MDYRGAAAEFNKSISNDRMPRLIINFDSLTKGNVEEFRTICLPSYAIHNLRQFSCLKLPSKHRNSNERVGVCHNKSGLFSQWGIGIGVGFFTETASFLRNPGVRRSLSYPELPLL